MKKSSVGEDVQLCVQVQKCSHSAAAPVVRLLFVLLVTSCEPTLSRLC